MSLSSDTTAILERNSLLSDGETIETPINKSRRKVYNSLDVRQLSYMQYAWLRISELFKYRYALKSAVTLNLKRRYRRSTLGFAWSLLNPLLTMAVLALMFGTIFHQKYQTFSVYVFSALLPWNFIAQTLLQSTESFVNNESSLRRVVLPKTFYPMVTVCTEISNFLLSLASFLILGLLLKEQYSWALLSIPLAVIILGIFAFGLGISMAVLTVYWRDLQHIAGVIVQLLFYMVPIIYPLESLSQNLHWVVQLNPFYSFIELFRFSIYDGQWPSLLNWAICGLFAIISLGIGLRLLQQTERELLFRL
jgi:ABC-type polysaccharide/polyol phosphate export permease